MLKKIWKTISNRLSKSRRYKKTYTHQSQQTSGKSATLASKSSLNDFLTELFNQFIIEIDYVLPVIYRNNKSEPNRVRLVNFSDGRSEFQTPFTSRLVCIATMATVSVFFSSVYT